MWLSVAAAVALLLLDAFVAPPAHDVHSLNGVAIKVQVVPSITRFDFVPITPSQSLADIRCQLWHADFRNVHRADACPDAATLALSYWSQLTQSPATLYVGWLPCGSYSSVGEYGGAGAFNVEYVGSSRKMIIHCYFARPWVWRPGPPGTYAIAPLMLLLVPTNAIPPGTLSMVQDDRLEHLFGDQSSESTLSTATIS